MTLAIQLQAAPACIRDSLRVTLEALGVRLCDRDGQPIVGAALERTFREIGNNTAQALLDIDTNPENA